MRRYICEDCGIKGKANVRVMGGAWCHGAMLCESCIDTRQERRMAACKAGSPCRDCGAKATNCLGLPENPRSWQCEKCRSRSEAEAVAKHAMMFNAGGMNIIPLAR